MRRWTRSTAAFRSSTWRPRPRRSKVLDADPPAARGRRIFAVTMAAPRLAFSPRDEVAASVEVWQLWQRVKGYMDPIVDFNPFNASIADGTDRTTLVKLGGQWTHLFGSSVETNINTSGL